MFEYHSAVNDAAKQLCLSRPSLLADRKELFQKARNMVHEKGYNYKKKKSRSSLYEEKTKEKKQVVTNEIRSKRIAELSEDISEVEIEMRLQMQQREKLKNINELTKAISCTEKLSELRGKKRKMQEELTVLQIKDAKVKKAKKSAENRKAFEMKQSSTTFTCTIDSFFQPGGNQKPVDNRAEEKGDSSHETVEEANDNTVQSLSDHTSVEVSVDKIIMENEGGLTDSVTESNVMESAGGSTSTDSILQGSNFQ